jgi:hypothetical protein
MVLLLIGGVTKPVTVEIRSRRTIVRITSYTEAIDFAFPQSIATKP